MHPPVRESRADHPNRTPTDHANLDPRRAVKHPKVPSVPRRSERRPG